MTAPAFTPGPWNLEGLTAYALNREWTNRFNATVQEGWTAHARTRTGNSELVANARLIAAAPELYEALHEIETICTESAAECRRRMGTRAGNCLHVARAALAKAVQP